MRPPIPSITLSRRAKIALWTAVILIALIITLVQLTGVYINFLWFDSVGFRGVYTTIFWTRVTLFFLFGVVMALVIGGNIVIAYLLAPPFRPMSPEQQNIERYRAVLEPRRILVLIAISLIAFFSAGLSAQDKWSTWQLWLHGRSFGMTDPQFHLDVSFFAFDYPAYRLLLGFGFSAIIFSIILSVLVHYLSGAIRLQTPGPKVTVAARRHLTILAFVFVVLKAIAYWLDRYGLVFSHRGSFTGASYTDVHAVLPSRLILFWIALVIAAGLIASLWLRSSLLPGIAFVSMLVLSILISGIYPAILQGASVGPNQSTKEAEYIKKNITATRQAYNIVSKDDSDPNGDVTYQDYPVTTKPRASALTATDNATINNIRVLDPNIVSPAFNQFQQNNRVYGFAPKLDIDRYTDPSTKKTTDYIVGVRELDAANLSGNQTNWINSHTNYTHGFGFVAADAGVNITNGENNFAEGEIPPQGFLNSSLKQNAVYYGELMPDYSIVGAEGRPQEFDGDGKAKVTYAGGGGVSLGSFFSRLAFAVNYQQTNFLLNDAASATGAHIVFNRDPRVMVKKVAPFLTVDSDPYPIVDSSSGHVVWMVDAYTTMDDFPYSARESLSSLTNDTLAETNKTAKQPNDEINYIRNSVKATVDAYTGQVKLYAWDENDPLLKSWRAVFPGLVLGKDMMPPSIRAHVRYPQDLFKVQRTLLGTYHVNSAADFYNVSQKWTVPNDNTDSTAPGASQPPYYVLAAPPGGPSTTTQFQLTSPMNVNDRQYLAAYISADGDATGSDYGKITVLRLQGENQVSGPEQVFNQITSDNTINRDSLYATGGNGATVLHGNLLTLPMTNSFMYVEPLYRSNSSTSGAYPVLQRVIIVYGNKIGYGKDLPGALSDFLPGHSTGETLQSQLGTGTQGPPAPSPTPSATGPVTLDTVDQAISALQKAYQSGDSATIGKALKHVQDVVQAYKAANGGTLPVGPSSSSSTSASSSAPPSSPSSSP